MSPSRSRRAGRAFTAFLAVACAVLAVQVVLLSLQNRELARRLDAPAEVAAAERRARLEVGEVLQPFRLRADDGSVGELRFDSWATLLLVFAEQCPACPLVFPDWEDLLPLCRAASVPVVGLRLDPRGDETPESAREHPFSIHTLVDAREVPMAELATVPLTVLLDDAGRVLWCHYGSLGDADRQELRSFLE